MTTIHGVYTRIQYQKDQKVKAWEPRHELVEVDGEKYYRGAYLEAVIVCQLPDFQGEPNYMVSFGSIMHAVQECNLMETYNEAGEVV